MTTTAAWPLGPFDVFEPLGRGTFGEVRRAVHRATDTPAAVKLLTPSAAARADFASFQAEVRAVAMLRHPSVALLFDAGRVGPETEVASDGVIRAGQPWLAMELADDSLARWRPSSWTEVAPVVVAVLEALAHAHARGVLHKDVKPGNVLRGGERPGPKLTDFGLADLVDQDRTTRVAPVAGTPAYMAPEQVAGTWRDLGPWTDLYALGCLAWRLTTGAPPFRGSGWKALAEAHQRQPLPPYEPQFAVPRGLRRWLEWLLAKEVARRCARAADALGGLHALPGPFQRGPPAVAARWRSVEVSDRVAGRLRDVGRELVGLRDPPLVDREAERDRLWSALVRVHAESRPRAVLLRGPGGTGKSRLARWLAETAHRSGAGSVATALHTEGAGALDGLHGLVASAVRGRGLAGVELAEHVRAWTARHGGVADDARWLVRLLEGHPMDARERYAAIADLLRQRAGSRVAIVVLDDVHQGADAIAFARFVLGSRPADRVLLVLTARDDLLPTRDVEDREIAELASRDDVEVVEVGALPEEHREGLVRAVLPLEPGTAADVARRAGGNALFTVEIVQHLATGGRLRPSRDGFRLLGAFELPPDPSAAWDARIAAFVSTRTGADAEALEVAAILGCTVEGELWRRACAVRGVPGSADLVAALIEHRLATRDDRRLDEFSFVHALVREALERRAAASRRLAGHHLAVAAACAARGGTGSAELVGRHRRAAGDDAGALEPLVVAAEELRLAGDLGRCRALLADVAEVGRALGLAGTHPALLRAAVTEAWLHCVTSEPELAVASARRTVAAVEGDRRLLAEALDALAVASRRARRFGDSIAATRRARAEAEAIGAVAEVARALIIESLTRQAAAERREDIEEAETVAREAVHRARAAGDEEKVARAHLALASFASMLGRLEEAERRAAVALRHARASGSRALLADALLTLGNVGWRNGGAARACRRLERAVALYASTGAFLEALARVQLALAEASEGRMADAEATLLEAAERTDAREDPSAQVFWLLGTALVSAGLGRWAAFDDALADYLAIVTRAPERCGPEQADLLARIALACERGFDRVRSRRVLEARRTVLGLLGDPDGHAG